MSANNKVLLKGVIGAIRFFQTKEKKEAVGLSLGTRDSYKNEKEEWVDRKAVWHNDLFAFSDKMVEHCKGFKKDDIVELEGQLEYRKFMDEKGNKKNCASIIIKSLERKVV